MITLPAKLPYPWKLADETDKGWRVGYVMIWGTGFSPPQWILDNYRISIRPGETGKEAYEREYDEFLGKNMYVVWQPDF